MKGCEKKDNGGVNFQWLVMIMAIKVLLYIKLEGRVMQQRLISIFLIVVLMIGANGCMGIGRISIVDKMIAYMNEKYPDDVFVYKEPFGGGAGISTKKIIVSSEKYPDADIYVMCVKNEDGTYKYSDNYLGVKYNDQTVEMIKDILTTAFGTDFFLSYNVSMYGHPQEYSADTTFEEYIDDAASDIGFLAVIGDSYQISNKEELVSQLEKLFSEKGMCCNFSVIYFDNSSEEYKTLERGMELSEYLYKKLYKEALMFDMESSIEFSKYEWRE